MRTDRWYHSRAYQLSEVARAAFTGGRRSPLSPNSRRDLIRGQLVTVYDLQGRRIVGFRWSSLPSPALIRRSFEPALSPHIHGPTPTNCASVHGTDARIGVILPPPGRMLKS